MRYPHSWRCAIRAKAFLAAGFDVPAEQDPVDCGLRIGGIRRDCHNGRRVPSAGIVGGEIFRRGGENWGVLGWGVGGALRDAVRLKRCSDR